MGFESRQNSELQYFAIEIIGELTKSSVVRPYFLDLMREQDINGNTPFVCALQVRAYSTALRLWSGIEDCRNELAKNEAQSNVNETDFLNEMFLPTNARCDDSPLFVLCYNDTCSFTWTGDEHVNQDIFECKTCGLVGSLCCCTECAYTCHRNHDCM